MGQSLEPPRRQPCPKCGAVSVDTGHDLETGRRDYWCNAPACRHYWWTGPKPDARTRRAFTAKPGD